MTTISIHKEKPLSVTTSSGAWAANTATLRGLMQQVLVIPATSTTTYDFSLTDVNSDKIYERTDVTGTLNEEVNIPITGVYAMAIANATNDESFDVSLTVRER